MFLPTRLALLFLLPHSVYSFSCILTASDVHYDLSPLAGFRSASSQSSTPPSTSEARAVMDLCSADGVQAEDDAEQEDKCPANTRLCLKLINHKPSSSEPDRVTQVIGIWPVDIPDERIWTTPIGSKGQDGLRLWVEGEDYAGSRQHLNFTFLCDPESTSSNPTLISYTGGKLSLEWSTPTVCPYKPPSPVASEPPPKLSGGFWSFIKSVFWIAVFGLSLYLAIGIFYNHQQYSARGWDLVPHRVFWREFPMLLQDLFSHLFAGLKGSNGGRGGYSSLG